MVAVEAAGDDQGNQSHDAVRSDILKQCQQEILNDSDCSIYYIHLLARLGQRCPGLTSQPTLASLGQPWPTLANVRQPWPTLAMTMVVMMVMMSTET